MITSAQNPKIQLIRSLLGRRKEREAAGLFIAEGVRLVEEALQAQWTPTLVVYTQDVSPRGRQLVEEFLHKNVDVEEISPLLMNQLTQTETSQGVLAVLPLQSPPLPAQPNFVVIIDALRDPGNLGTILRTAAAAGADGIILTPGTTDAFAPKVLRSGMGAHFRLPILEKTWPEIRQFCKTGCSPALSLLLAEAADDCPCWKLDLRQPLALIVGGEAEGATSEARLAADSLISIPMPGNSESLNAAVAAGILLFEIVRQRMS